MRSGGYTTQRRKVEDNGLVKESRLPARALPSRSRAPPTPLILPPPVPLLAEFVTKR